jgi:AcrR family transcriptional regulator
MSNLVPSQRNRRPGRPRASETPDAREQLKVAARQIFGSLGYDGASVAQIAKAAGVAPTAVYHHFGTKESLWEEVFLEVLDLSYSNFEKMMLSQQSLLAALEQFLGSAVHMPFNVAGSREFLIRCAADMRAFPELAKYRHHRTTAQLRVFRGLTELGRRSGEVHPERDPEAVTELLRTLVMGNLWERYTHPDQAVERTNNLMSLVPEILELLSHPAVSAPMATRSRRKGD